MNYKDLCINFIEAIFNLQDRWRSEEHTSTSMMGQSIEGDDVYYLTRDIDNIYIRKAGCAKRVSIVEVEDGLAGNISYLLYKYLEARAQS